MPPANCDSCSWIGSSEDVPFVGPDEILSDVAAGLASLEEIDPAHLEDGFSMCPECGSTAINFDYD